MMSLRKGTIGLAGNAGNPLGDGKFFEITCAPHVAIKLKRVFEGAHRRAAGVFWISATDANAHELAWFMERHPLEYVDDATRKRFTKLVRAQERKLKSIVEIESDGYVARDFQLALPPREYQRIPADLALRTGRLLIADQMGLGKEQPVDTLVMTPTGWQPIGAITVGDRVIGSDGKSILVTGVYPQGVKASYRVAFSDGTSVEAGNDHLWALDHKAGGRRWERIIVTTEQMRTGAQLRREWPGRASTVLSLDKTPLFLPMLSSPIEFDPVVLPIKPYLLGQLIANASLSHGTPTLVSYIVDWPHIKARLIKNGTPLGAERVYNNVVHATIKESIHPVRALGLDVLSGAKRIPPVYMRGSPKERIALLQGLMDGDGSCSKTRNKVTYHTTSPGLADDVVALVQQLGGIASSARYERDSGEVNYAVRVRLPPDIKPFSIPRKASRYTVPARTRRPVRVVESVSYVRDVESVCIRVDAPDRLYVTEHAILTHNTIEAICAFAAKGTLPAVVVTMTHLQRQWERELARFMPTLTTHRVQSTKPYKFRGHAGLRGGIPIELREQPDVLIVTYSKLDGWADVLAAKAKTVVFDEIQELRHADTQKYDAALAIASEMSLRIGLSGTPVYNYGKEIFNICKVLSQGELGTDSEFLREWCSGHAPSSRPEDADKVCVTDPAALGTHLRSIGMMIRRTRADVGRELPGLSVVRHVVEIDAKRIHEATADVADLAQRVLSRAGSSQQLMQWSSEIDWKMRQATGIAKAPGVVDLVRLLVESGERVVLFGWHREVYSIWQSILDKHGVKHLMYTGSESDKQKDENAQAFMRGEADVFIMSLRSGAGLDGLQKVCSTVVIGELDWSPKVMEQDIDRVNRDGQLEKVMAYYAVAEEGSDPVVADVLGLKASQATGITDPDKADDAVLTGAGGDHVRRLAVDVLTRRGIAIPEPPPPETENEGKKPGRKPRPQILEAQ